MSSKSRYYKKADDRCGHDDRSKRGTCRNCKLFFKLSSSRELTCECSSKLKKQRIVDRDEPYQKQKSYYEHRGAYESSPSSKRFIKEESGDNCEIAYTNGRDHQSDILLLQKIRNARKNIKGTNDVYYNNEFAKCIDYNICHNEEAELVTTEHHFFCCECHIICEGVFEPHCGGILCDSCFKSLSSRHNNNNYVDTLMI